MLPLSSSTGQPDGDPPPLRRGVVWGRGGTDAPAVAALYAHISAVLRARGRSGSQASWPTWLMAADEAAFARACRRIVPDPGGGRPEPDVIVATSGSTDGQGHLVGLTWDALVASGAATLERLGGPGLWVTSLPLHGIAGFQVVLRSALAQRPPRVYAPASGFDEAGLAAALADTSGQRRYLSLVPTQLHAALAAGTDLLAGFDAVLVGGAALAPDLADRATAAGVRVVTTYGSTETSGGCVYDGVPLDDVQIRLVEGQVQVAGPMLATGYLDLPPDAAGQPLVADRGQRWLVMPDAAHREEGRWVIDGRLDDVLISGGSNVSPALVERALAGLDGEWLIVGVPDPRWGQLITAVTTSAAADLAAARAATAALRPAERPQALVRVTALPRRPTGKPDRREAAALARTLLETGAGERR